MALMMSFIMASPSGSKVSRLPATGGNWLVACPAAKAGTRRTADFCPWAVLSDLRGVQTVADVADAFALGARHADFAEKAP